jgi:AraC family transcriptional regulator of adaptative response/methylated-DNA-[protein]-cysteine methyltransferase
MRPSVYHSGGLGEAISYACRKTALGLMAMASTETGICFIQFAENEQTLLSMLIKEFPNAEISASSAQNTPELDTWIKALDQHISAGIPIPDLPIDMRGTAFQMKVWQFLLSLREGEVLSYSQLAQQIDKPKAVRAVATACAKNRIAILIPCHRILRSDGGLGGYRWGIDKKKILLEREALIGEEH